MKNPLRNNDLAQIHIAKKDLAMTDDTYRALLERITGKTSTKAMNISERVKVLNEFKRLGWSPKSAKAKGKQYAQPHSRKLIMLWKELYQTGHVQNKTNAAMELWVRNETGKASPDWLTPAEAARLIEALKTWAKRPVKETQ